MPATKKKKTTKKTQKAVSKKKTPAMKSKKMSEPKKTGMSMEMQNAMLLLFAGGMIVLAYILYVTYA